MSRLPVLLRNLFGRRAVDQDLNDELDSYVELLTEEKIAGGLSPEAAARAARIELGGKTAVRDAVKSVSAGARLQELAQDVRYAARTLRRQPGFLLVAVGTIALGIGVNASIFSILNSLLLRPLPAPDSQTLVSLYQKLDNAKARGFYGGLYRFSVPEFTTLRDNNHVLSGLAAYSPEVRVLVDDNAQPTEGQVVSCNYFGVLEAPMALGRGFSARECEGEGSARLVVLGNDFWRRQYKSDPSIVGRIVRLNRVPVTVIGVAAPGFGGTDVVPAAFWAPLPMMNLLNGGDAFVKFDTPNLSWLELIGRRSDGVDITAVSANLDVIEHQLDKQRPGVTSQLTVSRSTLLGAPNRRTAVMGAGAVVLIAMSMVLMIACANLANLMLARAIARGKEIAMRLALGASRGRIVRQLLTEALLIAAVGGAIGALLAFSSGAFLFRELLAHLPAGTPPIQLDVRADYHVLIYAFLLTVLTSVSFGLMPALRATRPDLNNLLKQEGAGLSVGRQGSRGRAVLIGGQVSFCMVLLLASGLMLRALLRAQTVDPGFNMRGVAVLSFDVARVGYNNAQAAAFNSAIMDRVRSLPGVQQSVLSFGTPLGDRHFVGGFVSPANHQTEGIAFLQVTPGFFSLVDIPILRGRDFSPSDVARGAEEVIVSESMARSFWPGEDPIGKNLKQDGSEKTSLQVVGVARDAEVGELGDRDRRFAYVSPRKADQWMMQTVMVRYNGDFSSISKSLQAAARSLDPGLKVDVAKLEDNLGPYRAISRLTAGVAGILGALALVLAMVGLYGTVAYGVNCRTREIGVRMALGATRLSVLKLLTLQAMRPVTIGACIGIVLCAAVSRVLSGMLLGVSPHDAITFTGVPALLLAISLVAAWLPARRALRVDPAVALREN